MDALFEDNLTRNGILGATAIWQYAWAFHKQAKGREGPLLPTIMLVLPMVFHAPTVAMLAERHMDGALFKALAEDRTITVGLQRRMQKLAFRSFCALNLAVAAELVAVDRNAQCQVLPQRKTAPFTYDDAIRPIVSAAARLGHCMALYGYDTVLSLLGVKF